MNSLLESPAPRAFQSEKITFTSQDRAVFNTLKLRIKNYFASNSIDSVGNTGLYVKSIFFLGTYIGGFISLFTVSMPGWAALLTCAYLGLAAAAIGFNLMHDGAHGSFSNYKWANTLAAYCINLLGGDALLWKNKHNMIHHTYTNIEGHDQDIALSPVLRSNLLQPKYAAHKFQHIYCFLVYGLSSILWVFVLDFQKFASGKVGNISIKESSAKDKRIFWATKLFYAAAYIALPIYVWGFGSALIGFMVYHFLLGTTLSVVFQLAHVVEDTEFTDKHFENNEITDEWAIHQLKTTANFATKNAFVTWYTGGLNYQVEHHLFPKISHVHYPAISAIVKEVCKEKDIAYQEYPSFTQALISHLRHLKTMGSAN